MEVGGTMSALAGREYDPNGYTLEMAEYLLPHGVRFELHGGAIHVMTPAAQWHSDVQMQLVAMFRARGLVAGMEVGLSIGPRETRVLDVAVFKHERDRSRAYFSPDQIALGVEVVSPSTADSDFVDKPILYAELGIGEFWRITERDHERYIVEIFTLDTDRERYLLSRTCTLDELEADDNAGRPR